MLCVVNTDRTLSHAESYLFRQAIVFLHKDGPVLDLVGVFEKAQIAAGRGPGVAAEKRSVILQQAVKC